MKKQIYFLIIGALLPFSLYAQTYQQWVEKSIEAIEKKDLISAEAALTAALRAEPANPANPMLLTNLGTIQRQLKQYDKALISYNSVLAKYPDNISLLQSRASLYCDMEEWNNALIDYNHIIEIEPNNTSALQSRALIFVHQKKYNEALSDYEKVTSIIPQSINGWMGIALVHKRKEEWSQAEEIYTTLIYKHRGTPEIYANRAECYLHLKKLARTQQDIERAIQLGYNEPYIYVLRALLRLKQYDSGAALMDFEKAKEMGFDLSNIPEYQKLIVKKTN